MVVGQVDHTVDGRGGRADALGVVEGAPDDLDAEVRDPLGGGVGAGEARDLVTGREQLGDDGRSDPAGRPGDEDAHGGAFSLPAGPT